jgi:catechol 2,3-dioxygenase-like lactoylglutathione lyase family enzyme
MLIKNILFLTSNVKKSAQFFQNGLGLSLIVLTDSYAELKATQQQRQHHEGGEGKNNSSFVLALKQQQEQQEEQSRGEETDTNSTNTIILNFEVSCVDTSVKKLLELGATLDGPIQFTDLKSSKNIEKVAALRTPIDGHSIGLFEPREKFVANK